ncbi:sugar transferase [Thalassococcus lentus]|uniref:Sugar transferase n=1 Tax=Thalassococcus lentus TaxID=1210524 RepID=A0ABT4XPJ0_9RHOB|nr:sugar transferase [Thalassococcus lentus]MDA7423874.1 sugar transferase [Thalassococcus lentus]
MTVHFRQPLPTAEIEKLIDSALVPQTRGSIYRNHAKRAFDVTLVLLAAIPVLLILLPLCILVARDGQSPIYLQKRVGQNGRVFNMWKLRSMVPNADEMLEAYLASNPEARAEWDHHQKLRRDPRITTIGRIIRKTSLDELPQLWNVLRGDMSIVGPRPMMLCQRDMYPGSAYYALRPGITGFWQTSVRNESSFSERASFDADYLRKVSFITDIAVMFRTVKVVMNATGV